MAARLLATRLRSRLSPTSISSSSSSAFLRPHHPPLLPTLPPAPAPVLLHRLFSSAATRRPSTARSRPVDIGARARQIQNRRLWTYALTFSCVAGFIVIVLANFQDQMVFYITPTEALERFLADPSKSRFRLGGLVLEGSIQHPASSNEMEFVVTDLITDILVRYEGTVPDLFREGHSVVVEGFVRPYGDEDRPAAGAGPAVSEKARSGEIFFRATEVLAKHDEKYMPKEVAVALERNRKKLDEEAAAAAAAAEKGVGAPA